MRESRDIWQRATGFRPLRRGLSRRRVLALVALIVAVLIASVLGYRAWQTSYYEGLYARNHTVPNGQPLYRPCAVGVNPTWLLSQDGGTTYRRTTFEGCESLLQHGTPGAAMVALEPYRYGDAEVDLWMFQNGAGAAGETGLVVRADPATGDMLRIGINQPSRTWSVREHAHGQWVELQAPTSSGHIEPGQWNNLLSVIMRGDEYAVFINYHFVGVYHKWRAQPWVCGRFR